MDSVAASIPAGRKSDLAAAKVNSLQFARTLVGREEIGMKLINDEPALLYALNDGRMFKDLQVV